MKKLTLVIALALVMAMAFGTAAFAAQAINGAGYGGTNQYQATPTTSYGVYENGAVVPGPTTFKADGESNYPYEIYLPNEKSPENYRIHSNYTKNTDSCASCHATHTAVGASLLQWYSTYETCMACHDGTVTTTYNVEDGEIGITGKPTFGGAFGDNLDKNAHYASSHNVKGSVSITAAPGGSVVADTAKAEGGKDISMWQTTFGCQSCHSPHGQGGNARVLHPDPNGWATKMSEGVYFELKTVGGATYAYDANGNKVTLIKGYPYATSYFTDKNGTKAAEAITVSNANGVSEFTGVATAAYVKGTASIRVQMNIKNYLGGKLNEDTFDPAKAEDVQHIAGINNYCGACHVDYNTESQSNINGGKIMDAEVNRPGYGALTGVYSSAHRHAVGLPWNYGNAADTDYIGIDGKIMKTMGSEVAGKDESTLSCLTCHFAHGVNDLVWEAWTEATGIGAAWASADMRKEITGSSALKRLPNMATCEACHQKQSAAEGYAANTNAGQAPTTNLDNYLANAAHEAYFAGNTYQDATTCATCHASALDDFMGSVHWSWNEYSSATKDYFGGKLEVKDGALFSGPNFPGGMPFGMSDRFCGLPGGAGGVSFAYTFVDDKNGKTQDASSCGKCHPSIGLSMPPLFLGFMGENNTTMKDNIDCLSCHLDRADYDPTVNKKVQPTAMGNIMVYNTGNPDRGGALVGSNDAFNPAEVGKDYKIQKPENENCMTCHEHAMAGPVYKRHALYSKGTDIHAAMNMDCMDCHSTSRHEIARGIMGTDLISNDRPDVQVSCVASKCHPAEPHTDAQRATFLNSHTKKLACEACHVATDTDAYANAAREFVNHAQAERGYPTRFNDAIYNDLFKGGALFNDFRWLNGSEDDFDLGAGNSELYEGFTPKDHNGIASYGFLNAIPEWGYSEWQMSVPGNYAWRWFNGNGGAMATALASFGFYDPYEFQDGFMAFRGTDTLPTPPGFEGMFGGAETLSPAMMAGLFNGYWEGYNKVEMFAGANAFDKEYYQGEAARKGGNGDKIYPFRKLQAWMPVPRTNFWFLTPHDLATMKNPAGDNDTRNYDSIWRAIESPMMYMYFSGMFKPAMDLYAQEFGFQYAWKAQEIAFDPDTTPDGFKQLVGAGIFDVTDPENPVVLNGFIYAANGQWLDAPGSPATGILHMNATNDGMTDAAPSTPEEGQQMLQNGQLSTYMYFPMPLDANIMASHAIAAKDFVTSKGESYEPRACSACHSPANGTGGNPAAPAKPFDNPNWNPLIPTAMQNVEADAFSWVSNFDGSNVFDWKTLGYTDAEITRFTSPQGAGMYGLGAWGDLD